MRTAQAQLLAMKREVRTPPPKALGLRPEVLVDTELGTKSDEQIGGVVAPFPKLRRG